MIFVSYVAAVMKYSEAPCEQHPPELVQLVPTPGPPRAGRTGAGHLAGGFVGQAFPLLLTHKIRTHLLYLHSQIFSSSLCRSETNLENQLAPVEHQ